jgi:hypothetical protein
MQAFRTRIGKVKFRNGCEIHRLPSFRERCTVAAHSWLDLSVERAKEHFSDDMAGFVLIPWTSSGEHKVYTKIYGRSPNMNTLPHWTAEAIRRDRGKCDVLGEEDETA